jgi:hypothetical protein
MADDSSASIIQFTQAPKKRAMTPAERQRLCRARKRAKAASTLPATVLTGGGGSSPEQSRNPVFASEPTVGESVTIPQQSRHAVTAPSRRRPLASWLLTGAALASAVIGMTINGWFSRSLGSSESAGWLFLAIGVVADLVALASPTCAAFLWQGRQRVMAGVASAVWAITFVFAVTSGVGFASINIADVTVTRASRVTPAVMVAQTALSDAMTARDRECRGGVGKFCRERESAVIDRRAALDTAMQSVHGLADPQADAAVHLVAWVSRGFLKPTGEDFSMLRLVLLALLPQIGGILLMIGRGGHYDRAHPLH